VRAFIYPVKDQAGNMEQVVLVHEDITEQFLMRLGRTTAHENAYTFLIDRSLKRSLISSATEPANSSIRVLQGTTVCRFHYGKHAEETLQR
jgi:hypothetical protein